MKKTNLKHFCLYTKYTLMVSWAEGKFHLYKGSRNGGFAYGTLNYAAVNWEFSLYVRKIQSLLPSGLKINKILVKSCLRSTLLENFKNCYNKSDCFRIAT